MNNRRDYQREYMRRWRQDENNRKRQNAASREYYRKHRDDEGFKEMLRDTHRKWVKAHPEKIKEYAKRAYLKQKKNILEGC